MTHMTAFYKDYGSLFERACEISREFEDAASAFVPAVPENWSPGGILYFGSATYGWNLGENAENLMESAKASKYLMRHYPRKSRFWQIAKGLQQRLGNLPVVWSNLHKIGSSTHEPGKKLREAQMKLSADSYRYEVQTLKPGFVVFAVGDLASDTLPNCLGEPNWNKWKFDTDKTVMSRPDFPVPTIWMTRRRIGSNRARLDAAIGAFSNLPDFKLLETQTLKA